MDVPAPVLAQLGLKIQHALRAFTAKDRKGIRETADNYPETEFYTTEDIITHLGIGEALVTTLNEKGIPSPLVHCMIRPPQSRMDILTEAEIDTVVANSGIASKYNEVLDSVSAYELLTDKLEEAEARSAEAPTVKKEKKSTAKTKDVFDNPVVRSMTRTAGNTLVRSLLGVLGLGGRGRRKSIF
jgi:hypothetical protein